MTTTETTERLRRGSFAQILGRVGMVCFGVVHLLVAWLAIQVAFGGQEQTDQKGAIAEVAQTPVGPILLWLLAIGLVGYALWQFLLAAAGYGWITGRRQRTWKRVGAAGRGVAGAVLVVITIGLATGSAGGSGNEPPREFTARLLAVPAGQVLVVLAGAAVIAVAVAAARKGVRKTFLEDLEPARLPRVGRPLGMVGYVAKGVAYALVGLLIVIAGLTVDPNRAGGLDAALHTLRGQAFGPVLLLVVALGFVAFGAYCLAAARAHRA